MKIVILTGAGISAESGVKTFRDANGLWENHPIEDVATPEGFSRDPELVHSFYNARRAQMKEVEPNSAHKALAALQNTRKDVVLITQNVDNLHERGGFKNPLHMHGELMRGRCQNCQEIFDIEGELHPRQECSSCGKEEGLRPHIVWFGEVPFFMDQISEYLANCDLFAAIGTSSQVYPAAQFVQQAKSVGAYCVELNLERTPMSEVYDESRQGKASELVPQFIEQILQGELNQELE